jgi:hypothetical protein
MDQDKRALFILATHTLRFATEHPYAATGIFGAAVGSAVTYRVMKYEMVNEAATKVFTPKVYKLALSTEDLHRLLADPAYEMCWDTPDASLIITSEKKVPPKELPIIQVMDNEPEE